MLAAVRQDFHFRRSSGQRAWGILAHLSGVSAADQKALPARLERAANPVFHQQRRRQAYRPDACDR